ncbi:MAG TPA: ATP-binding protein, partial [Rhodothermales bacterium]|nr:ATP-binding protein [Rhodothermales bacterium]
CGLCFYNRRFLLFPKDGKLYLHQKTKDHMALVGKSVEALTETVLLDLIRDGVRESRELDFKQDLRLVTDSEKKEFLADVVSFANASGGFLVFGMSEEGGIAKDLMGMDIPDVEVWVNGLESMIRDAIQPRITGIRCHPIPLSNGRVAAVIQIPRSWALPHAVTHTGAFRFYARNASGKYPLDVTDLRALFALSEGITHQLRQFRMERISRIMANETPVRLFDEPKIVFHLLPLNAFDPSAQVDLGQHSGLVRDKLSLLLGGSPKYRYNFDGFLVYAPRNAEQETGAYTQFFRNGAIEYTDAVLLTQALNEKPFLDTQIFEEAILRAVTDSRTLYEGLNAAPPFVVMLSLMGVRGHYIALNSRKILPGHTIDRDVLMVQEVLLESFEGEVDRVLKPCFDAIWQAGGYPYSMHYMMEGKRRGSNSGA